MICLQEFRVSFRRRKKGKPKKENVGMGKLCLASCVDLANLLVGTYKHKRTSRS